MNGKTMLNGVPYFSDTQVIELTRSEYDALPNSKYTDGVLYCIKDEGVMKGDTFSPIIYSLAEREIGVWTDGKPLYEKTIHKTNVPPSSSDTVLVLESEISPDLDSVHHIEGMFGRMQVNSSPYGTDGYNVVWGFGSTYYHYNWYNENAPHVWLTYQYTKTTDNPGTGKWTTSGVPARHYSTDEQVIGTWIDGSTLYEKTVQLTLTPGLNTATIAHGISGINRVIDYNGSLFGSMYGLDKTCKMSQSVFNSSTSTGMSANATYCANIHYVDATNVMYSLGSAYPANIQLNLTVQYTKSS